MPNRLVNETSPYLLQHAENPVDWFPWGAEALQKALEEDKPIFLSIGYAACHWCHVMAHESFEDPRTAEILNRDFVSIKVDREERPDLDSIYMSAVVAMTGQGGWPMSVFLLPDGRPFFGGTYFPPARRYGMLSFTEVLAGVISVWHGKRSEIFDAAGQLYRQMKDQSSSNLLTSEQLDPQALESAAKNLVDSYDWQYGGWGPAPKFPMPMAIDFLLSRAARGDTQALAVAEHALKSMQRGGMYDLLGGGFHRYSTDAGWLIPHFEKMLYDNAQLARVYLHAFKLNNNDSFKKACVETLEFIQSELSHPAGGFFSSLDADSEGVEGKYYTWDYNEVLGVIDQPEDIRLLERTYGLSQKGNFEGKNILQLSQTPDEEGREAQNKGWTEEEKDRLDELNKKLLAARAKRVRPLTDDKVLVVWNALAIQAFAEAGRYLDNHDFTAAAQKAARFLLENCTQEGRLFRSWRAGQARIPAFLEDYAALILALLVLYEADFDNDWYTQAVALSESMLQLFSDPNGGFFDTPSDQEGLIVRPKELQDSATPSGNALAAFSLLKLSELTGQPALFEKGYALAVSIQKLARQYPRAFSYWLQALDFAAGPRQQIALLWPAEAQETLKPFLEVANAAYRPRLTLAGSGYPSESPAPAVLEGKKSLKGTATAYLCEDFICLNPATDPGTLTQQLKSRPG